MPTLIGAEAIGTTPIAGEYLWGKPTVSIDAQPEVTSATPTFSFSFTAFNARPQVSFQYRVASQAGHPLYLSPELPADTSFVSDYYMSDGTTYKVAVRAWDGHQWSDWSETTTYVVLDDPTAYPVNTQVGSVYEIAINGIGYMLADDPGDRIIRRQTYAVEQPRFAVGSTPFAESVDRYSFGAHSDWRGGAGQQYAHRPESATNRYQDSWLVDPFQEAGLRLVHQMVDAEPGVALTKHAVVADGELIVACADSETDEMYYRQPDGTDGTFEITGATPGDCLSLVSDGKNWYYANGADIWKGSGHTDPGSAGSSLDAQLLCWAVDRLAAVVDDGTYLCVTTFDDSLGEEVSGGRFKYLKTDVTIPAMTAGDGFMWWLVNRANQSQVHFWQVGSEDEFAANALTLPAGQKAVALFFYLGNVMVGTVEEPGPGCTLRIYRCIPTDGQLTPELVIERHLEAETTDVSFTGVGRQVLFTWEEYDPDNVIDGRMLGTGCFDLATGGWARWMAPLEGEGAETGGAVVAWNGLLVLVGDNENEGLFIEDPTLFETEGVLHNSVLDFASGIRKQAVELSVSVLPLPVDSSVEGLVSISQGASFAVGTIATPGSRQGSWEFTKRFDSAQVAVVLSSDGSVTPTVNLIQLKVHPVATVDQLVQFPIRAGNDIRGLNGAPIPINNGTLYRGGVAWATHTLLSLSVGQRVQLQDVDWPHTQATSIWEVVEVDSRLHGSFNPAENRRVDTGTVFLTLRRAS